MDCWKENCVPTSTKLEWMVCAATSMELAAWRDGGQAEETFLTGVGIPLALAQTLDAAGRSRPARLVNIGIAGAYPGSGLAIGDIVVGTSEVYGDLGFELPEAPHFQHIGEMTWGAFYKKTLPLTIFPKFVGAGTGRGCTVSLCTGTEATGRLRENLFDAAFETMEGAAVAQAGQLLGIPVCEVRAISNIASHRDMRPENIQLALERLTAYLQKCRETTP
jgi:futalosine hydrolase